MRITDGTIKLFSICCIRIYKPTTISAKTGDVPKATKTAGIAEIMGPIIGTISRKPAKIIFNVEAKGVRVDKKFHAYDELNSFWVNYDPPHKNEAILETKKTFNRHVTLNLENTDPNKVRKIFLMFLKEKKPEPTLIDALSDLIGI